MIRIVLVHGQLLNLPEKHYWQYCLITAWNRAGTQVKVFGFLPNTFDCLQGYNSGKTFSVLNNNFDKNNNFPFQAYGSS